MLYRKQIWAIFLNLSSKWQLRQFKTSTMYLAQELLTNVQCGGGARNFAKETRALKMRSTVAGHLKLTTTNWEDLWSWSYNYMGNWRTQCWLFYGIKHLKQIGKVKNLDKWMPHKHCNSKILSFWSGLFSYSMQQQSISQSDCDLWPKNGFYMTTNEDQLFSGMDREAAPKYFPKPNLNKKRHKKRGGGHLVYSLRMDGQVGQVRNLGENSV